MGAIVPIEGRLFRLRGVLFTWEAPVSIWRPMQVGPKMGPMQIRQLRVGIEGIFSDAKLEKIAELPGATVLGPNHFAGILDRVLKADRYLHC